MSALKTVSTLLFLLLPSAPRSSVQREGVDSSQLALQESESPPIASKMEDIEDLEGSPVLAARAEDWQSVSEGVETEEEEEGKQQFTTQPVPEVVDSEDLVASADSSVQECVTPPEGKVSPPSYQSKHESHSLVEESKAAKPSGKRSYKHTRTRKSESESSPSKYKDSVPSHEKITERAAGTGIGNKLPSTWAECARAIKRHYQEEESREKQAEKASNVHKDTNARTTGSPFEMDESRNSYSGYEADQEDNVVNKSTTFGQTSPVTTNSPELPDEIDSRWSAAGSPTEAISAQAPSKPELPNHGLFVGEGWPGQQQTAEGKRNDEHKDRNSPKWQNTMAEVYETTCEPEMWQIQLDHADQFTGTTRVPYDPVSHPPVPQMPVGNQTKPGSNRSTEPAGLDSSVNHGLFIGSGWPAVKQTREPKKEQEIDKQTDLDTERKIERSPSPQQSSVLPESERSASPQTSAVTQEATPFATPPTAVEFDDPLFGDFNNPWGGDVWEPESESSTTILHTEPALKPFWGTTEETKQCAEADQDHIISAEQQHTPCVQDDENGDTFDLSIPSSNPDVDRKEELPVSEQTTPQLMATSQTAPVTEHVESSAPMPNDLVQEKMESKEANMKPVEETTDEPQSPKTLTNEPEKRTSHENGTAKSKNKRRRHKKKKTLS